MHRLVNGMASASYLVQKFKQNPEVVTFAALLAPLTTPFTAYLQGFIPGYAALMALVAIDFFTKIRACRIQGIEVTTAVMREKGLPKIKDYTIAVIAAYLTVPLAGDDAIFRGVITMLGFIELWSIVGENLYDAGAMPVDLRKTAVFDAVREIIGGALRSKADEGSQPATKDDVRRAATNAALLGEFLDGDK